MTSSSVRPHFEFVRLALVLALTSVSALTTACSDDASDSADDGADTDESAVGAEDAQVDEEEDTGLGPTSDDAGGARDAGVRQDASVQTDAGRARDGAAPDASQQRDAAVDARDSGRGQDAAADAGGAPDAASTNNGPSSCQPAFKAACAPEIVFKNEEPTGRGALFNTLIPDPIATMQDVACTVCSILYRSPDEIPQKARIKTINLTLRDNPNVADASGNSIRVDLKHLANYTDKAKASVEYRGVLVHETAHLYQNYGNNGLGEGMADFVRIRVGLYEPGRRTRGGNWTDPYTTSGFFFSWLAGPGLYHKDGRNPHNAEIGYLINKTIGESGPDAVPALFMKTFGESVDALWQSYQAALR